MKIASILKLMILLVVVFDVNGFGISTGICYSGCASVVVACYGAAGVVFGTITAGLGTPPAILACNAAFGTCMGACSVATAFYHDDDESVSQKLTIVL